MCVHWGRYFDEEWDAAASPVAFHQSTTSSSFSLLWVRYCETEGYVWPGTLALSDAVRRSGSLPGLHLDFGSGVGVTSQLFAQLGYQTTLADISTSMLEFARFRFARRGTPATFLDLNKDDVRPGTYDLITATDVLSLVSDFEGTARRLYTALKPGGFLCANIHPAPPPHARWQLQTGELSSRRALQRLGFEPVLATPWSPTIYRRVPNHGVVHQYRVLRDALAFSPVRGIYRTVRDRVRGHVT
jgi:SAM-dependent methyltransferase